MLCRSTFWSDAWTNGLRHKNSPYGVAVVGCGPAGLTTAIVLERLGHAVTLIERFDAPKPIGSGIILQPTGLRVLQELGLHQQIIAAGKRLNRIVGHSAPTLRRVLNVNYSALGAGYFGVAIHRAALFDVLLAAVTDRGIDIITDKEVVGVRHTAEHVSLLDSDNRLLGPFDLIVDASGSGSRLRGYANHPPRVKPLEYGAIWGSFDWPDAKFASDQLEQRYVNAHTMIGVMPVGISSRAKRDQVAFFWSLKKSDYAAWQAAGLDAWKTQVRNIWPETDSILDQIVSAEQMTMALYAHHTMKIPFGDRIVFVGDAAHATSPQLGQGANMALLDAWALGNALDQETILARGLGNYAASRRRHVRGFQLASLLLTPFYQSDSRALAWVRDWTFDTISRLPGCRRIVAGLISGMLGNPLGKIGLQPRIDLAIKRD